LQVERSGSYSFGGNAGEDGEGTMSAWLTQGLSLENHPKMPT
jgi:hypothetical protein